MQIFKSKSDLNSNWRTSRRLWLQGATHVWNLRKRLIQEGNLALNFRKNGPWPLCPPPVHASGNTPSRFPRRLSLKHLDSRSHHIYGDCSSLTASSWKQTRWTPSSRFRFTSRHFNRFGVSWELEKSPLDNSGVLIGLDASKRELRAKSQHSLTNRP